MKNGRNIWLKTAHTEFAKHGEKALNIDILSKQVGKSRSSFYHLFGDMEEFLDELIDYDLEITRQFTEEGKDSEAFFPDYAEIMVKYKDMLFFNKHMFLGRNSNDKYNDAWNEIASTADTKTEDLWMKLVNMEDLPPDEKAEFYLTIRTAAFMRLQYGTYTYDNIYKVVTDVNRSFGFLMEEQDD